jgi:hypothetical protein
MLPNGRILMASAFAAAMWPWRHNGSELGFAGEETAMSKMPAYPNSELRLTAWWRTKLHAC